ncbi:MAG TPA: saccharopine dehydrogenase NADP-binding domain-containing protein, partial [Flavisolibacter sp.]|nr:saccharopine dehydrogenase NADP-binding domain-containing protein [Flavisolibacter sp.]
MRKGILLFGAGKSATVLIDYLLGEAWEENWLLTVVDTDLAVVNKKIGDSPHGRAASFDIFDDEARRDAIRKADIVISLMPPSLQILIAKDCVAFSK